MGKYYWDNLVLFVVVGSSSLVWFERPFLSLVCVEPVRGMVLQDRMSWLGSVWPKVLSAFTA